VARKRLAKWFLAANARRVALIKKRYEGFTKEEMQRNFTDFPGWEEESLLRQHANLTDAERAELADLQEKVSREIDRVHPMPPEGSRVIEEKQARALENN
jgi:hypothetical protein